MTKMLNYNMALDLSTKYKNVAISIWQFSEAALNEYNRRFHFRKIR